MPEIKKVAVEISHCCLVDDVVRNPGDVVLMDEKTAEGEPFAKLFGTVLKGKLAEEAKDDEVKIREEKP